MSKKIFCPKCDEDITITPSRLEELRQSPIGYIAIVCPQCTHQIRLRKKSAPHTLNKDKVATNYGHIVVLENGFCQKQYFSLSKGLNHIGRRNKDTETDIPVITGDPSMDRHHAIIRVSQSKQGDLLWALADDDSRVGTFVANSLLGSKEWYYLKDGDVFTLGATTIIFSSSPNPQDDEAITSEGVH